MHKATAPRRYRLSVWLIWLLVVLIMGLQPSLMPTPEADAVARGTGVVLTARPGRELFPWWPRGRWRQRAVRAYRRWQQARRQAWRAAQVARLAGAGAVTLATLIEWCTAWQVHRQVGALPVLYAVLESLQVQAIINRYCPSQREIDTGTVAVVLILNRLLAPRPLCHIADWLAQSVLVQQLGLPTSKFGAAHCVNDDRLARTFATRALAPHGPAIWAEIVDIAQRRYDLDLGLIFYDLTAFVTHGDYAGSDLVKFGMAHNTPSHKRKVKAALGVTADGNVPIDYWGVPVAVPFEHEGRQVTHRGLVVLSGPMRRAHTQCPAQPPVGVDADTRTRHFEALWPALNTVAAKAAANTPYYRSTSAVRARAETQLRRSPVGQFVAVWTTGETGHIQLHWRVKVEALHAAMERDGRYLLVTNDPALTPQLMLTRYRQKDGVEKCNAVCKQDLVVNPIHLHQDERIQALLLLNMVALLTYRLVERQDGTTMPPGRHPARCQPRGGASPPGGRAPRSFGPVSDHFLPQILALRFSCSVFKVRNPG